MASIAELVDFLMSLMRDDDTRRQFEQAPDATLTDRGLENVTGQDVRDARLMMADDGAIRPHAKPPASSGSDDAVREISLTTTHFEVGDVTTTVISIDDRDTVVVDSFNNDVVAIQDNDTTDVDVISIVEGDEEPGEEGKGEEEGDLGGEAGAGAPDSGLGPDGESVPDPEAGEDFGGGSELTSGVSEGFTPEDDSGFGAQPELGAEAGLTPEAEPAAEDPATDSFDELVG
jgi:hypothetical protein